MNFSRIILSVAVSILCMQQATATNYYISNKGNDGNSGTGTDQPWQTIAHLNASFDLIEPGDSILFKRGEIFFGAITVASSGVAGKPIVFSAYGEGDAPVITGFITIRDWEKVNDNTWQASAPGIRSNLNMVVMDHVPQRIGRYPNANAPDGGYLRYENTTGPDNIIDSNLATNNNWTGAEIVVRKNHWTAERCRITRQDGMKLTFTNALAGINTTAPPRLYEGTKGFGYFFQKDRRTLDQNGEWFLDSTAGKLQVYMTDTNHVVMAAAIDTLVDTKEASHLVFSHLHFTGANITGICNKNGEHITIKHCHFANIGAKAIQFWGSGHVQIENVNTNNILSNAIQVRTNKRDHVTVKNCIIKNTAPFIGMGSFFDDRDYKAVSVSALNYLTVENNIIDSTGLSGIQFQGNNVLVQHNLVNHYCLLLDDGAGIYSFVELGKENAGENFVNRIVQKNIVLNGRGAPEGGAKMYKAEGIYMDGRTMNVDILDNTIAYTGNKAFACNNSVNVHIRNNTCFNNGGGWGINRTINWQDIHGFEVKHNIFYAMSNQQKLVSFSHSGLNEPEEVTVWEAIRLMGEADSNYYNTINPVAFVYSYAPVAGKPMLYPSPLTFENWQALTGQDAHSKRPAVSIPSYTFRKLLGNNLVKNGGFDEGMDGFTFYGTGAETAWDNSGKITGKGSLKIACIQPQANRYVMLHAPVGALQAEKNYLFRFTTLGTSECGIVRAYLRKTTAPYTTFSSMQVQSFGVGKQLHECLLTPAVAEEMSFVIEIEKNSCTAYIDDVSLQEADATPVNIYDRVRFEYNATEVPADISLSGNYSGVDGTKYNAGVITLQPFSSVILIKDK